MQYRLLAVFLAAVVSSPVVHAGSSDSVLAISTDNDLFAPTQTDRDYTAGMAITYSSNSEEFIGNPVSRISRRLDGFLLPGIGTDTEKAKGAALEFGVYGFTPEEIKATEINLDDRPYSSLVYFSSSQSYQSLGNDSGWTTSMTLGVLGLDVFKAGQNSVHKVIGSERARGWGHQISNGGEPTFRYSAAYHQYLDNSAPDQQFKVTYFGSVGYLTEFGAALVFRDGLISSPDNRFNPELMAYGERAPGVAASGGRENYFWGGMALKARAYNAFLQGQFRDSDHELDADDLNILLAEVWAGYTHSFVASTELSYVLRVQSSEIKDGTGNRTLAWGGLVFSKRL
ncbi:lipid A deacylase LpxR family protein [Marinobacter sp. F4206]|uniref:lipid A deacylase LpxR family protein n=1 Tax=Marinobacter sp. F4206 TaxID=2861777 RepID=UPI001C5FEA69|nr:lipid A deacylase LpxR family protein [Marinobacter sp. F4206]MBW4933152.1 lipid A deacylase LpxR family protein [Marinobacter sp. F4206]